MRKTWRFLLLLLLPVATLALQACGPKHKAQEDCGFVQNVYGERISWKGNVPITLYLHESVPEAYRPAIESAMRTWELAVGRPLFQLGGRVSTNSVPQQDGVNVIYLRNVWEEDKVSEQARTSVYWVNDEIREADIKLNGKNFKFFVDTPSTGGTEVHLESLLIHELGHVLGLKHKDNGTSVMATYLASNVKRTNISTGDYQNAMCEY